MTFDWPELGGLLLPLVLVAAAALIGLIVERLVLRLIRLTANPTWKGRDVLLRGLRGTIISWFVLAGLYAALLSLQPNPRLLTVGSQLLSVGFIISLTLTVARIVTDLVELYTQRKDAALPATSIIINLTRVTVLIIGGLLILRSLQIDITPILTTLGVGALAVALALQDTLANLFAGLQMLAAQQIRPGDVVRLDSGEEGTIEDIGWRTTTIQLLAGSLVLVPNSKLAQAIVINHDLPTQEIAVLVEVNVSRDSDLARVEVVTIDVAREVMLDVSGGVPSFEPFIRYNGIGPYSITFNVIMRAQAFGDQFIIRHEFIKRLLPRYNAESIVIPLPIQIELTGPVDPLLTGRRPTASNQ